MTPTNQSELDAILDSLAGRVRSRAERKGYARGVADGRSFALEVIKSLAPLFMKSMSAQDMSLGGALIKPPEQPRKHKFSSTHVTLSPAISDRIRRLAGMIPDADLGDDGREGDPHVTVLYGLHTNNAADIRPQIDAAPLKLRLGKVSVFPGADSGKDYDVLKVDVESSELHRLNKQLARLPHTNTHPEYNPHATIAYVRAGLGAKYAEQMGAINADDTCDHIVFSDRDGAHTKLPLHLPAEMLPVVKAWEENKHHRDHGKFASGSGNTSHEHEDVTPSTPQNPLEDHIVDGLAEKLPAGVWERIGKHVVTAAHYVYGKMLEASPAALKLIEQVVDTPGDMKKFGYAPSFGPDHAALHGGDAVRGATGLSTHLATTIASHVLSRAVAYAKSKLAPQTKAWEGSVFKAWEAHAHPRDDHGRFIAKKDLQAAQRDPEKAKQLRDRVTDPEERAKLDKQIGGEAIGRGRSPGLLTPQEQAKHHAARREEGRAPVRERLTTTVAKIGSGKGHEISREDVEHLAANLHLLTRDELREHARAAQQRLGGVKAQLVDRLLAYVGHRKPTNAERMDAELTPFDQAAVGGAFDKRERESPPPTDAHAQEAEEAALDRRDRMQRWSEDKPASVAAEEAAQRAQGRVDRTRQAPPQPKLGGESKPVRDKDVVAKHFHERLKQELTAAGHGELANSLAFHDGGTKLPLDADPDAKSIRNELVEAYKAAQQGRSSPDALAEIEKRPMPETLDALRAKNDAVIAAHGDEQGPVGGTGQRRTPLHKEANKTAAKLDADARAKEKVRTSASNVSEMPHDESTLTTHEPIEGSPLYDNRKKAEQAAGQHEGGAVTKVGPNRWMAIKPKATQASDSAGAVAMPDDAFASAVMAAHKTAPTGRFGGSKVFISHLHDHLQKTDPRFAGMGLDDFKRRLVDASRGRHLTLSRADMAELFDPDDLNASESPHLNTSFHFVTDPSGASNHLGNSHKPSAWAANTKRGGQ